MDSVENMEADISNDESTTNENNVDMTDPTYQELLNESVELEKKLSVDQTDYQSYLNIISIYKTLGLNSKLLNVYHRFQKQYPLPSDIWISWLREEIKCTNTDEDRGKVKALFEKAVQDYLSVDIWLEYINYVISLTAYICTTEDVRCILERAIIACGSHVTKGELIWKMYREFENSILNSLKSNNEESNDKCSQQMNRIAELYRRQLMIPLLDMEQTYADFEEWIKNANLVIDIDSLQKNYEIATKKLQKVLQFERSLANSETGENSEDYLKYLDYELNCKTGLNDLMRVRCLFERAIADNPLNSELWTEYIEFVEDKIQIPEDALSVTQRATRNLPWLVKLWISYVLTQERYHKPKQDILDTVQNALANMYMGSYECRMLWLCYLSYMKRLLHRETALNESKKEDYLEEIRSVVYRARDHLTSYFGEEGDRECRLLLWLASFELEEGKDKDSFHSAWEHIMNSEQHRRSSYYWLKYINMEIKFDNAKRVRKLFSKALMLDTDSPETIAYEWLEYESHTNDFEQFVYCQRTINSRLEVILEKRKKDQFDAEQSKQLNAEAKEKKDKTKKISKKQPTKPSTEVVRIKRKDTAEHRPEIKDYSTKVKNTEKTAEEDRSESRVVHHDSDKDNRTVFLSNLAFHSTEEDIKTVLSTAGAVEEVRLVKDYKGSSKGYGFVVFSTEAEAESALNMDRTPLDKRPMFISPCDVEKSTRKTGIRFNTGLEKNKLFVKGLPLTFDQKDVRKIFQPYGSLRDVRIVTFRNGYSKGLAYVDYDDEDSAAQALLKTDGLIVDDHKLDVALSNPPEKKNKFSLQTAPIFDQHGKNISSSIVKEMARDTEPKRHARTQISLVPRVVQVSSKTSSKVESSTSERMDYSAANDSGDNSTNSSTKKGLSNDDFRSMLLGK